MTKLDIYVLGAGASYIHGAPRRAKNLKWERVPGLVDVLSMVDVAIDRKESLARRFDRAALRDVRAALEYAIFVALEDSLSGRRGRRRSNATRELVGRLDPKTCAILSFNYDVIVDVAIARHFAGEREEARISYEHLARGDSVWALRDHLDYGVEFANIPNSILGLDRFRLLKLHGSFNWLLDRVTGDLHYGGLEKAVGRLYDRHASAETLRAARASGNLRALLHSRPRPGRPGRRASEQFEPILVTPTHLKDLRNAHLARIWRQAEKLLRQAGRITFIGYSLPGDDLHVKYLFKRALETRPERARSPSIVVVEKGNPRTHPVRRNYETFFGQKHVEFHGSGFETWLKRHHRPLGGRGSVPR